MPTNQQPFVIVITGPTASGKTELAMQLKDLLPIELINMDSAQVYKDMDIGTAKITKQEQQKYPHHLMDIITPEQTYSVAEFINDTQILIHKISSTNKIPLLVGGTPLYFNALTNGLSKLPSKDNAIRKSFKSIIEKNGIQELHRRISLIDPELAKKIAINDSQRLIRFLEIATITQKSPSQLFKESEKNKTNAHFFHIKFSPNCRNWLHKRIEKRCDTMLSQGFVEEVIGLTKKYQLSSDLPSMKCAGYKQILQYLNGEFNLLSPLNTNKTSNTAYQEMRDRSVFSTRQLAKRQITWLKKFDANIAIDPSYVTPYNIHNIVSQIDKTLNKKSRK